MIVQDRSHSRVWDMIPLAINGTAPADELEFIESHLRDCADCRDEYAFQLRLHAGMQAAAAGSTDDAAPALQRLFDRIDDEDRRAPQVPRAHHVGRRRPRSSRQARLLGAAVAAQAFALALLGASLLERPSPAPSAGSAGAYETLSSAMQPSTATIRLVPAPTLSLSDLQALLSESGLRVVAVSEDGAIYSLAPASTPAAATQAQVLARLRASAGVLLAEPVGEKAP